MLPFGVTIPANVPQRPEIPEGLMNYPVLCLINVGRPEINPVAPVYKKLVERSEWM
jgi:hypothetical protein